MRWEIVVFGMALVLYTVAIWSHQMKGQMKPWMMRVFGTALVIDTLGTVFVCGMQANWKVVLNLHTVSGLIALLIMGLHFAWARRATKKRGMSEHRFKRWSPIAWFVWLVSFYTGIPRH